VNESQTVARITEMIERLETDDLQATVEEITPTIAGPHEPEHAPVRTIIVQATKEGLVTPKDEVLVNAIKDGGDTADEAFRILRERMVKVIINIASKSGIDIEESMSGATQGIWEAARRYDSAVASSHRNTFRTYAHPWMRKMSRPRTDLKPGRKDRPSKYVLSMFEGSRDGDGDDTGLDSFCDRMDYYRTESPHVAIDVAAALDGLDLEKRSVTRLLFMEGRSIVEVARLMGISSWRVRHIATAAKETLRETLAGYHE